HAREQEVFCSRQGTNNGLRMTIRGGGNPILDMACAPRFRMGPPPRSFAADAYDCIMVRIHIGSTEYKCVARGSAPDGEFPSDPAPLAVHPPSECSGVKVLRNPSSAKAARLPPLPFRPPDPFRALREPDRSRRDREAALPAPNKRERSCGHGGDLREKPVDTKSSIIEQDR